MPPSVQQPVAQGTSRPAGTGIRGAPWPRRVAAGVDVLLWRSPPIQQAPARSQTWCPCIASKALAGIELLGSGAAPAGAAWAQHALSHPAGFLCRILRSARVSFPAGVRLLLRALMLRLRSVLDVSIGVLNRRWLYYGEKASHSALSSVRDGPWGIRLIHRRWASRWPVSVAGRGGATHARRGHLGIPHVLVESRTQGPLAIRRSCCFGGCGGGADGLGRCDDFKSIWWCGDQRWPACSSRPTTPAWFWPARSGANQKARRHGASRSGLRRFL